MRGCYGLNLGDILWRSPGSAPSRWPVFTSHNVTRKFSETKATTWLNTQTHVSAVNSKLKPQNCRWKMEALGLASDRFRCEVSSRIVSVFTSHDALATFSLAATFEGLKLTYQSEVVSLLGLRRANCAACGLHLTWSFFFCFGRVWWSCRGHARALWRWWWCWWWRRAVAVDGGGRQSAGSLSVLRQVRRLCTSGVWVWPEGNWDNLTQCIYFLNWAPCMCLTCVHSIILCSLHIST